MSAALIATIAWFNSPAKYRFSIEEKVNISALANRICKEAAVTPCTIEWRGTDRGFGTLAGQGARPVASAVQIRSALALSTPKWTEAITADAHTFTNGRYSVTYVIGSGDIVITSMA